MLCNVPSGFWLIISNITWVRNTSAHLANINTKTTQATYGHSRNAQYCTLTRVPSVWCKTWHSLHPAVDRWVHHHSLILYFSVVYVSPWRKDTFSGVPVHASITLSGCLVFHVVTSWPGSQSRFLFLSQNCWLICAFCSCHFLRMCENIRRVDFGWQASTILAHITPQSHVCAQVLS